MTKKNILILSAGRRVSLVHGFVEAARECSKVDIKVYTADMSPHLSAACQISDGQFTLPHVSNDGYEHALAELCQSESIGIVIPTIDTELHILAGLRDRFIKSGVTVLVCDSDFVNICDDKRKTAKFFCQKQLPTPDLYDPLELTFPVLVKPYDGSLSAGVYLLKSQQDLTANILDNPKNIYCKYIDHTKYEEFTVDMYYDKHSVLKCVVPRKRLEVRGGEVAKALADKNEIVQFLFDHLRRVEGARGCLTLQLFRNSKTLDHQYIEINARFGGGYPLSRLAGADFQKWILQEYLLNQSLEVMNEWREKTLMLRYDAEVIVNNYAEK